MSRYRIRLARPRFQHPGRELEVLEALTRGVSHDFSNVLMAILAMASAREANAGDPRDIEAFRIIGRSCKRGRDLVKALAPFCRRSSAEITDFEAQPVLEDLRLLLDACAGRRIRVEVQPASGVLWCRGDAGCLLRALMDLGLQAVEGMPGGSVLSLKAELQGEHVEFKVEGPFGNLVLERAQGLLRVQGGLLTGPPEGRWVRVGLPVGKGPEPAPAVPEGGGLHRILLVDDDPDVRFLVGRMLKAHRYEVEMAQSGEAALARLDAAPALDLIILDEHMPGMDGQTTLAELRKRGCSTPVLISSGHPEIEHWPCFQAPGVGVLSKPFDLAELLAKYGALTATPPSEGPK